MMTDTHSLAEELAGASAGRQVVSPPSSRDGGLDLATAYAVERELVRMRLCLAELASAMAKQSGAEPLGAGDLVSSGRLTLV